MERECLLGEVWQMRVRLAPAVAEEALTLHDLRSESYLSSSAANSSTSADVHSLSSNILNARWAGPFSSVRHPQLRRLLVVHRAARSAQRTIKMVRTRVRNNICAQCTCTAGLACCHLTEARTELLPTPDLAAWARTQAASPCSKGECLFLPLFLPTLCLQICCKPVLDIFIAQELLTAEVVRLPDLARLQHMASAQDQPAAARGW